MLANKERLFDFLAEEDTFAPELLVGSDVLGDFVSKLLRLLGELLF